MKYACIDIGTNTVLLAIVEAADRTVDILDISTVTRLGEGLKGSGELSYAAMERTFATIREYSNIIRENRVDRTFCVGTAALREAKNSRYFVDMVEKGLGIKIEVITERQEAFYTYLSVSKEISSEGYMLFVTDIGGGSTEIIKGDGGQFDDFVSLPVGSVKLTEMFIKSDPPSALELSSLRDYIHSLLDVPFYCGDIPGVLVGTGGTVTNVASIVKGMETFEKERIHGCRVKLSDIEMLASRLKGLDSRTRSMIKGMEKGREDIILQGVILLMEIIRYFEKDEIVVSANGVRYGVILEAIDNHYQRGRIK